MAPEFRGIWGFVGRLGRKGRKGGAVALFLAALLGLPGVWMLLRFNPWNGGAYWFPAGTLFGLALMTVAGFGGFVGLRALVSPTEAPPLPTRDEFLAAIRACEKPARLCLACRIVLDEDAFSRCGQCGSEANLFIVTSDADVHVVAASFGE